MFEDDNDSKNQSRLREDIHSKKKVVMDLHEETLSLEQKNKQLAYKIKANEAFLTNNLEEINKENKNFMTKLQSIIESKNPVLVSTSDPFVKRNLYKIQDMSELKNSTIDQDYKSPNQKSTRRSRSKSHTGTSEEKKEINEKLKEIEIENKFIINRLSGDITTNLPSYVRSLIISGFKDNNSS